MLQIFVTEGIHNNQLVYMANFFFRHKYLILLYFICYYNTYASDTIVVKSDKLFSIESSLQIFEDKSNKLAFDEIVNQKFFSSKSKVPNLGISKSTFWIKMIISNKTLDDAFLLDLSLPTIDFIEFYFPNINNKYESIEMGEHLPFIYRKYSDPDYLFDLNIKSGTAKVYFIKIASKEGIQLPIKIGSQQSVLNEIKNKSLLSGLYFGVMLVIIFYNLFIYLSVKDKNYLFYVVYVIFTFLTQISLQGYSFQFLWPNFPPLAQYSLFIFPALTSLSGIIFMKVFLNVKFYSETLNKIVYVLCIPYFISFFFVLIDVYKISQMMMEISSMIVSVFMLITPIIIIRKGFKPAKYFLLAWSVFLLGIIIYVLKDFEILPFNNFTRYTMQIGSAIETVLLSFALADKINILKKEKEQSQATTLLALQQNEKLITDQNIVLEQKVTERTLELNETLSNLKSAQAQLVDAEKMASLGQLTAGIAHEINNPINFVSANVKPLKLDIDDVLELINKYEVLKPNELTQEKFEEIETFRKKIDFNYLKQEMADLLSGIEDGANRTADIVSGLKNFSRLDENDIKEADINEGIESTLILLKSSIPSNTEVVTDLGEIPIIECFPGKLNQVFMNLFSNALYAIKLKNTGTDNKLVISTSHGTDHVYVSVQDSGIGMTPEVKAKIFDPFFTTKVVGEGTGLGMSIVFKIIESHNAKIEVESEYGVGTKILLILKKKITS
jgi:two-component system NtrC family sensor kinase